MTLKTFHFAGVASMNVTLGVPRIKEIINASKKISTPIITAPLERQSKENPIFDNTAKEIAARIIKGRLERTTLGNVCAFIEHSYSKEGITLQLRLDTEAISSLQLELDLESVRIALLKARSLKLKEQDITLLLPSTIIIHVRGTNDTAGNIYLNAHSMARQLPNVLVHGISSVSRAVIHESTSSDSKFVLYVEGTGLLSVMTTPGVDYKNTFSNHVFEAQNVLGIEAARSTIISQIQDTMSKHGMTIDTRHVMLLADIMTYKGDVLGITRFGISKMKDSVLMLASFEQTADHLFTGAFQGKKDPILGVSECIILGMQMPIGTGLFKVLQNVPDCFKSEKLSVGKGSPSFDTSKGRSLLFDLKNFHPAI